MCPRTEKRCRSADAWFRNVILGITALHLAFLNVTQGSERSEPDVSPAGDCNSRPELLFDGRSLLGWKQSGNWRIIDGAIRYSRVADVNNDLHCTRKIPGDCEIVFEWKEGGEIEWQTTGNTKIKKLNPGFAISYHAGEQFANGGLNASYGAAIDYYFSGMAIRLHTHDIDDKWPSDNKYTSGFQTRWPSKDCTKPIGQWNRSRIVCKGSRIQFWLNENKGFDLDLRDKNGFNKDQKDHYITDLAVDGFLKLKSESLYLSVIGPYSDGIAKARVEVRYLAIREVVLAKQVPVTGKKQKSALSRDEVTGEDGVSWDKIKADIASVAIKKHASAEWQRMSANDGQQLLPVLRKCKRWNPDVRDRPAPSLPPPAFDVRISAKDGKVLLQVEVDAAGRYFGILRANTIYVDYVVVCEPPATAIVEMIDSQLERKR